MKINNQQSNKVKKLYRYVKFDCPRLEKILIQRKLYCYSPKSLNDPFDSKIQFTFKGSTDDDFRFVHRDILAQNHPELNSDEINKSVEYIIRSGHYGKPENQDQLRKHTKETLQPEIDNLGLLCLSEERADILMWSHYGDGHKGLCLEFDKQLLDMNFICRQVHYDQPYPRHIEFYRRFVKTNETMGETGISANKATEDLGQFLLCRKSAHWDYEHEWRLIIPWQQIERQNGDRFVSYPEDMLTGIILGCNTDESQC